MRKLFSGKNISRKFIVLGLITAVFLGVFFVNVETAKAQVDDFMTRGLQAYIGAKIQAAVGAMSLLASPLVTSIFSVLFDILLGMAIFFTGLCALLFEAVLTWGFANTDGVYHGWTVTRDIVNMFFILGLVVISFATILRIESYGMKALLPKLIIMALLINFSFMICGIIIDASHIVANFFLAEIGINIGTQMLELLHVNEGLTAQAVSSANITVTSGTLSRFVISTGFTAILIFLSGFVLLIGAILLFIRIVALWVLMILAPFAWFFGIFPGKLKGYADKWWGNFLKYVFFAPIYVFFIFLTIRIAPQIFRASQDNLALFTDRANSVLAAVALNELFSNFQLIFSAIFLIVILFGAPVVAMSSGMYGAGAVVGAAKGAFKGTIRGAYRMPGRLRKAMIVPPGWMKAIPGLKKAASVFQKAAIYTSPAFWKEAFEERKKERIRKAGIGYAKGKQQDIINRVFSLFQTKTNHAERAGQFEVEEEQKDLVSETKMNAGQLVRAFEEAYKNKQLPRMKAALRQLVLQKDHNDLMLHSDLFDKMTYSEEAGEEFAGKRMNEKGDSENDQERKEGRKYNNVAFKDAMYQMFEEAGANKKETNYAMADLSEVGLRSGAYGLFAMTEADEEGNLKRTTTEKQGGIAAAKYQALTLRDKTRIEHATSFVQQNWDYEKQQYGYGGVDPIGKYIMQTYSKGDIESKRFHEMREDTYRLLGKAYKDTREEMLGDNAIALSNLAKAYTEGGKDALKQAIEGSKKVSQEKQQEKIEEEQKDTGVA